MNKYSNGDIKNLFNILSFHKINISIKKIKELLAVSPNDTKLESIITFFENQDVKPRIINSGFTETTDFPILVFTKNESFFVTRKRNKLYYKDINDQVKLFNVNLLKGEDVTILSFNKVKIEGRGSLLKTAFSYVLPHKKNFLQLLYGIGVITVLQVISPFLMQLLIDKGLTVENINVVQLVLFGFIAVKVSSFLAEFIRSWLYLNVGTKISIELISDFLFKVIKLPINFFNARTTGDLLQRIEDNRRIENFLTRQVISFVFTISTLFIFLIILGFYDLRIFTIFIIGSVIYIVWVMIFWNIRKKLDVNLFQLRAKNQNILVQLLQSIQEVKLNNVEKDKRWEWEDNQVFLFAENKKMLLFGQLQDGGSLLINELKNSFIIYFSALAVIDGGLSFGAMMAIQYILGQANAPLKSITSFAISYQMALLSFERIDSVVKGIPKQNVDDIIKELPEEKSIRFDNVTFSYHAKGFYLRNINLKFNENEVTAIMGTSGGGKTTIFKMILKFHTPYKGDIFIGDTNLKSINSEAWRRNCGVILQDSLLFNDSILNNIALGDDNIDLERAIDVAKKAKIFRFIESTSNGFNTILNHAGKGLSQGQIQRILIARIMYKDPKIILLDEATNALDIQTENSILKEFEEFFKNKTVILIAHRLNTIKNADKIVVVKEGRVLEWGTHNALIKREGFYYDAYNNKKNKAS